MARHPHARRKQKDDPDDVFTARVLQLTAWAKNNTRLLVIAGAALVLLVLGGLYYRDFDRARTEQAELRLVEIQQTAMTGNRSLVIQDIETFLVTHGSTRAADEARLILGRLYLEEERPEDAVDVIATLASRPDRPLGAPAAFLLAAAHEAQDEIEKAEETYLHIADRAEMPYQQHQALDAAARIRIEGGEAGQAVELYERILDSIDEDSPERALYELRLAETQALSG